MDSKSKHDATNFPELAIRAIKESGLILLIGSVIFMTIALIGYDPRDPGWSHTGYQPQVQNFAGKMGAWCADLLVSTFGICAYLLPLVIIVPSIRFLLRRDVTLMDGIPFLIFRAIGALVFLASSCALIATHVANRTLEYPFSAGGLFGEALSDWSVSWFSVPGSSVVAFMLGLIGFTLFAEFSWQQLLQRTGEQIMSAVGRYLPMQQTADEFYQDDPLEQLKPEESLESENAIVEDNIDFPAFQEKEIQQPKPEQKNSWFNKFKRSNKADQKHVNKHIEPQFDDVSLAGGKPVEPVVQEEVIPTISDYHDEAIQAVQQPVQMEPSVESQPVAEPVEAVDTGNFQFSEQFQAEMSARKQQQSAQASQPVPQPQTPQPTATAAASTEAVAAEKGVKIVPLSETHQPMRDSDLGLEGTNKPKPKQALGALPSMDELDPPKLNQEAGYSPEQLEDMSRLLERKLKDFNVIAEVVEVNPGPVITRFEIQPAPGVKASKITNLSKDLARSMTVSSVRVVEVIPGKSVMGIEIPNIHRQTVSLSEVLNSKSYKEAPSKLTLGLGNDIAGNPVVANLAKMPHLLVAGTTGSGKSVGVNAMLLSLLFKATPQEVRLILVDPKMLELSIYEGIPHLLTPVITDMKDAAGALRWCVGEMERRYRLLAKMGVRNLDGFNDKLARATAAGEPIKDPLWNPEEQGLPADHPAPDLEPLPFIVVVIDEFADMMMIVGKKVEELIARIAQKARAAGIHLILATQRPSVDVITGLIKANVPTRIAFQVSSKIDSRTILDQPGAESLLGWGDMLYLPAGTSLPNRVHGAFVGDDEVHRVVEAWKALGSPDYIDEILTGEEEGVASGGSAGLVDDEQDALYDEAVAIVTETRKASISSVQRRLKIGYNRAARMIETMEAAGVVSTAGSNGQREVLAPPPPPRD